MIQHNVFFKWKPSMTREVEAKAFADFRAMAKSIPGVVSVSVGHQNSPENLGKGYQVGLSVVFTDAAARDAYLPHPEHEKVKASVLSVLDGGLDGVIAFDYAS